MPEEFLDAPKEVRIALCQEKFDSDGGVQRKSMALGNIPRPGLEDMLKIVRSLDIKGKISGPEPPKKETGRTGTGSEYRSVLPIS
ncbi:hypothetical protein AKJ66_00145 [candidate division MSBL1 archaeon SCGC-AAA259E22]|uniref:DOD-type homing endonuclease domain-containing protein n=1 Tax=candidate division MSBL1 archaeon SCGC-AAA259E22 TaxID=1698265 RepID=A0A133UIP0_9EURY|nr:hypothetical protein AKJ66_00145 [candidate division MSBL1 archaeon SCGC-AAA259E22]